MNNDILEKGEENSEKNCEKREPKRWSKVWDEFRLIKVGDKKKAICKHCEGCLTGEGSSGTKHLLRHLEKHCKKRPNTDFHSSKHATGNSPFCLHQNHVLMLHICKI
jgi:BED zinc finger